MVMSVCRDTVAPAALISPLSECATVSAFIHHPCRRSLQNDLQHRRHGGVLGAPIGKDNTRWMIRILIPASTWARRNPTSSSFLVGKLIGVAYFRTMRLQRGLRTIHMPQSISTRIRRLVKALHHKVKMELAASSLRYRGSSGEGHFYIWTKCTSLLRRSNEVTQPNVAS